MKRRGLIVALLLTALVVLPSYASGRANNRRPRLTNVTASIGPVYDEAAAKQRKNGLKLRLRVCDDGPPASGKRHGLINIAYRWQERGSDTFLAIQEQGEMITWEVYFHKPECVPGIPEDDPLPAFLPYTTYWKCLTVTVKVRDPGGLWSNAVTKLVKPC